MTVRGIRGATVVPKDAPQHVRAATRELLQTMVDSNDITVDQIASVIFTVTPDITAEYPARAARDLGWTDVALLGASEMAVPGGLARCIRVLIHVNTDRPPRQLRHIYLGEARSLRPDR